MQLWRDEPARFVLLSAALLLKLFVAFLALGAHLAKVVVEFGHVTALAVLGVMGNKVFVPALQHKAVVITRLAGLGAKHAARHFPQHLVCSWGTTRTKLAVEDEDDFAGLFSEKTAWKEMLNELGDHPRGTVERILDVSSFIFVRISAVDHNQLRHRIVELALNHSVHSFGGDERGKIAIKMRGKDKLIVIAKGRIGATKAKVMVTKRLRFNSGRKFKGRTRRRDSNLLSNQRLLLLCQAAVSIVLSFGFRRRRVALCGV